MYIEKKNERDRLREIERGGGWERGIERKREEGRRKREIKVSQRF